MISITLLAAKTHDHRNKNTLTPQRGLAGRGPFGKILSLLLEKHSSGQLKQLWKENLRKYYPCCNYQIV